MYSIFKRINEYLVNILTTTEGALFTAMTPARSVHPLEPLTPEEIATAVAVVRAAAANAERLRFVVAKLHEPADPHIATVLEAGISAPREAFLSLIEKTNGEGKVYEVIVDLAERAIRSWKHKEGVQPSLMFEEFSAGEDAIKADPAFQAALARRSITDLSRVRIDAWTAGNYGRSEEHERRILRTTVHYQMDAGNPEENTYAHPIAGLHAVV